GIAGAVVAQPQRRDAGGGQAPREHDEWPIGVQRFIAQRAAYQRGVASGGGVEDAETAADVERDHAVLRAAGATRRAWAMRKTIAAVSRSSGPRGMSRMKVRWPSAR